jgi:hypothetical protein
MFCKNCYKKNPPNTYVCSDCSWVLEETTIQEKEHLMNDFNNFFLEQYIVLDTDNEIGIGKMDIKKWRVHYNFWKASFEWKYFLFNLIQPIHVIPYIVSLFQNQQWKAKFHATGFPIELRDNGGELQGEVLDRYAVYSRKFRLFQAKNKSLFPKKYYFWDRVSWIHWVYFIVALGIIVGALISKIH